MGGTPNVAGMVADQDFQKLGLPDKRAALGKVTGDKSFASLSDADTMQFLSKFSKPANLEQPPSNAAMQAHNQLITRGTNLMNVSGYPELMNAKPARNPDIDATLGTLPAVGGTVGGALGGIPGAALGGGAGEAANQLIRRAAGDVPVTATPTTDIAKQAAIMGTAEGVGKYALSPFIKWLTASKTAGAAALQSASAKAGSAPVELSPKTNELVDELVQHSKSGGKPIKVISDLLERVGPSTKTAAEAAPGPLTYDEARIFQGNISSLSAEEQAGLKGAQKGLMRQLAGSFAQDVQKAADAAGAGEEHAFGMKEYATAAARDRVLAKVGKAVAAGAGVGGAAYMTEKAIKAAASAVKP